MFDGLSTVNWETLGATVLSVMTVVGGVIVWLKKNFANIKQLKADGAEVSEQVKYFKAMLKDNAGLKNEISSSKRELNAMKIEFKRLSDKKDSEITSLKEDLKLAIQTIKEGIKDV